MTAEPGRTWAQLARTAKVRVTSRRPGLDTDTRPSSLLATWTAEDPAAVIVTIEDPWAPGETVEWRFARNLFVAAHLPGLAGDIVGLGDVRVRYADGETHLWLGTVEGSAAIAIPSETILDLLFEAALLVPLGEAEAQVYADTVDADLAALLDGAA